MRTLEGVPIEVLTEASNLAFSDYTVPLKSTPRELGDRLKSCGYSPKWSMGAFRNGELQGFMFHGYRNDNGIKTLHNCGTGVVPAARGQALTTRQYQYLLPKAYGRGIRRVQLEVISTNEMAVHVYEKSGFMVSNKLCCFKGTVRRKKMPKDMEVVVVKKPQWQAWREMWDWNPSWQHSEAAVMALPKLHRCVQLMKQGVPVGYAVYQKASGRIVQFAIDRTHRKMGYGHILFYYLQEQVASEISWINVDSGAQGTLSFLKHIGLRVFLEQYDMELSL